jgi:hypothetical protein
MILLLPADVSFETDCPLTVTFKTVVDRYDACEELQNNFSGQGMSYVCNSPQEAARRDWRRVSRTWSSPYSEEHRRS